jgi:integrase
MPRLRLTQVAVEKLKPPSEGRSIHWDRHLPGFGLRVTRNGQKSWVAMYRVGGRSVMETLGKFERIPKVDEARELARQAMQRAAAGEHPTEAKERRKREAEKVAASNFGAAAALYVERYAKRHTKPQTWREVERQLRVDVLPRWANRPISSITRDDVRRLLERIAERGAPVQANRVRMRLSTLFNWAVREELIATNPVEHVDAVVKEAARDRILTDPEIVAFWTGCDRLGYPFGPLFRLLLLTGARRNEVAQMEWRELDLEARTWTIPASRAKNGKPHTLHMSDAAVELITTIRRDDNSPYVFTTILDRPVSGFNKPKGRLDEYMNASDWILHDLRRSAASGMARLGIAPHVVDRILAHTAGTIKGVAAVYLRYEYEAERKAALDAWGRYIGTLIGRDPQNVVPLRPAGV